MQRHELIQNYALKKTILIKYSLEIKGRCIEQKETGSTTNKMRNAAKRKF